jgi:tetratricopeptide (TPR) repeat protein
MASMIELFICYAREDEELRKGLEKQLRALRRQGLIEVWHDREISAGTEWEREIDKHLNSAQIILLLVSPDFMDSDYCYGIEMKQALERHERGEARVIPVILRPVYWYGEPLGKLQALPTDGKPVISSSWHNKDEAFFDVAEGIYRAIKEQWLNEGSVLINLKRYEEALAACEQAIRLDPNDARAYTGKGLALRNLKRHEEALVAYDQAIRLDPTNTDAYTGKGLALGNLKRHEEALAAFDQALRLDPNDARAYGNKVNMLKDWYEAVRAGRVKDPKTIRDIAYHFAVLANDPNIDFDAERAANNLYERAKMYEERVKAHSSMTSNIPAQPSPGEQPPAKDNLWTGG